MRLTPDAARRDCSASIWRHRALVVLWHFDDWDCWHTQRACESTHYFAVVRADKSNAGLVGATRFIECSPQPLNFLCALVEPVRAPDPVKAPSKMLQDVLPQPVSFRAQSALW